MGANISEFFGYAPDDRSPTAVAARSAFDCPFQPGQCTKRLRDKAIAGTCTLRTGKGVDVVICPIRLYGQNHKILQDIADEAFGAGTRLVDGKQAHHEHQDGRVVAVFGKGRGGELRLPRGAGGRGGYFVDWVIALLDTDGELDEFVAIEVQSIDTTGSYRDQRDALLEGRWAPTTAGLNWENVAKRILPQLLYKGNVLRREHRCRKGLFFVCPTPVYDSFENRIGGKPQEFPQQPGALTFRSYDPGPDKGEGQVRDLVFNRQVTTTLEQVATAIAGTQGLPDPNVYAKAIEQVLKGG
ncbi:MAG: hypothetical protein QOH58_2421 [Thermoleophilaceae bacterium]|nr:hypothetical protein [Thermoleophilaceae bacterium]